MVVPRTSSQVSVALPQQPLYVVLCVLGHTALLRDSCCSWFAMLPVASLRPVQNQLPQTGMTSWTSFVDGFRLLQSFWHAPLLQLVQFVPLCQQPQLQTELPSGVPTDFSISTSISCFRSSASFASIDMASSAICNCLLHLLLFLCHTLPHTPSVLRCCSSRYRFFNSAALHSSTSISS